MKIRLPDGILADREIRQKKIIYTDKPDEVFLRDDAAVSALSSLFLCCKLRFPYHKIPDAGCGEKVVPQTLYIVPVPVTAGGKIPLTLPRGQDLY